MTSSTLIRRWVLLLAVTFAALTLANGCKSSGGGDDELQAALEQIVANDLAIMVLPQAELGAAYAGLTTDSDSGFYTDKELADDTVDPEDEAADITDARWESGYKLSFGDETLAPLEAGEGVVGIDTQAHLFENAESAKAFIENELLSLERFSGEEVDDGVTLEEFEEFDVEGLPDGARGVRARISFLDETPFFITLAYFPLEQLVGIAEAGYADDQDVSGDVQEIAVKLRERMESVALGETAATPEEIPTEDGGSGDDPTVEPPEDIPDLSAMGLTLDDLPDETDLVREGYVADDNTVATYEQEFDISPAAEGSAFGNVTTNIGLSESTAEAIAVFASIRSLLQGPSLEQFLVSAFSEGPGFEVTNVVIGDATDVAVGEEAVLVDFSFDSPLGTFAGAYLYFRVDRVIGFLTLVGSPGAVDAQDLVPLAQTMAQRIRLGLPSG